MSPLQNQVFEKPSGPAPHSQFGLGLLKGSHHQNTWFFDHFTPPTNDLPPFPKGLSNGYLRVPSITITMTSRRFWHLSGQETAPGALPIIDMHLHLFPRFGGSWQSRHYGKVRREDGNLHQTMNPSFANTDSQPVVALGYMDWCGVGKAQELLTRWQHDRL